MLGNLFRNRAKQAVGETLATVCQRQRFALLNLVDDLHQVHIEICRVHPERIQAADYVRMRKDYLRSLRLMIEHGQSLAEFLEAMTEASHDRHP